MSEEQIEIMNNLIDLAKDYNKPIKFDDYLKGCTAYGGNWTAMMLSGIKNNYPEFYKVMPNDYIYTSTVVFELLQALGVYCEEN